MLIGMIFSDAKMIYLGFDVSKGTWGPKDLAW